MTLSKQKKYENALKWEKKEVEKRVNQILLAKAEAIAEIQGQMALEGNAQVGQYLLDRMFGKSRQQIGLDGGEAGSPILIMPSVLVNKFNLNAISPTSQPTQADASPSPVQLEAHAS